MTNIPIFDPLCTSKESVVQSLRKYISDTTDTTTTNIHYTHPFGNREQCVYNSNNNQYKWEYLKEPINFQSLLNQDLNLENTEDRILQKIEYLFANKLNITPDKKIRIQPIPEGKEIIHCSLDVDTSTHPCLFVISKVVNGNYFDLVITPVFESLNNVTPVFESLNNNDNNNNIIPLYYGLQKTENFPFNHSGDKYDASNNNLLHHLTISKRIKPNDNLSGIITAHAYNKRSFIDIKYTEPNICLVDYPRDSNIINIYLIHFPLNDDFVQDSSIGHICKFQYVQEEKKMIWTIPQQPLFDDAKFNVGSIYQMYKRGLNGFMTKVRLAEYSHFKRNTTIPTSPSTLLSTTASSSSSSLMTETYSSSFPLIIQKPLLNNERCIEMLSEFLQNQFDRRIVFTFHRNIGTIDDNDYDNDDNNYDYTLPIAGGSIISGKSTVKLGKPIKREEIAQRFRIVLNNNNINLRPVVVLSDQSSLANIPNVYKKLNAIYILVHLNDDGNNNNIEEKLNNINASLATSMQGSLSTIIVYLPSNKQFYYYRGIFHKMIKFGEKVDLSEILLEAKSRLSSPLIVPAFSLKRPIYNENGKILFEIYNNDDEEENNNEKNITNIIQMIYDETKPMSDINLIKLKMKYVLAQMEVNLLSADLDKMIAIMCERIQQTQTISKKRCLELIIEHESDISNCPTQRDIQQLLSSLPPELLSSNYNKAWLFTTLLKYIFKVSNKYLLSKEQNETFLNIVNVIKKKVSIFKKYEECLLEILNTSVSMRSSYGIRKKGLNQIIRRGKINRNLTIVDNMNDEQMDNFLEENCTEDGVIILAINQNKLIAIARENEEKKNKERAIDYKSLTRRYTNFDAASKDIASCYLDDDHKNQFNFVCKTDNFTNLPNGPMLMFPILKELKEVMKTPHTFDWKKIGVEGAIDITRMLLRKSIFELIPENIRKECNINNPGSPIIGKILINVLLSAIHNMADNRTDFSSSDESGGWITKFRCLTGLILSVMASGSNTEFSSVYKALLYDNTVTKCNINLAKGNENAWLSELIRIWPFLKLKNVINVTQNSINCIKNALIDSCYHRAIAPDKKRDKDIERKNANHKKALWTFYIQRPMINCILKRQYFDIINATELKNEEEITETKMNEEEEKERKMEMEMEIDDDDDDDDYRMEIEKINYNNDDDDETIDEEIIKYKCNDIVKDDDDQIKMQQQQQFIHDEIISVNDVNCIDKRINTILRNLDSNKNAKSQFTNIRERNKGPFYPPKIKENIFDILYVYEQLLSLSQNTKCKKELQLSFDKYTKKSYLFSLLKIVNERLKKDDAMGEDINKLLDIIYSTALELYLKKSSFVTHQLSNLSKYLDDENGQQKSNKMIQTLKYIILKKVFRFISPVYEYVYIPKIIIMLMHCSEEEHYKSREFIQELKNFTNNKKIYGHFMQGMILKKNKQKLESNLIKIQKLENFINKEPNLKLMLNFLCRHMDNKQNVLGKVLAINQKKEGKVLAINEN